MNDEVSKESKPEIQFVDLQVKGTKEVNEIGNAIKLIVQSYKEAVKDGWQPGQDIPQILMKSYQGLLAAIDDAAKADDEFKYEPLKAVFGAVIPLGEAIDSLRK